MASRPPPPGADGTATTTVAFPMPPTSTPTLLQQRWRNRAFTSDSQSTSSAFANGPPPSTILSPVRRKPLPASASPLVSPDEFSGPKFSPITVRAEYSQSDDLPSSPTVSAEEESSPVFVVRDLDKFPHGQTPADSPVPPLREPPSDVRDSVIATNVSPLEPSIPPQPVNEPIVHVSKPPSPPPTNLERTPSVTMALHPPPNRPPPLRVDSLPRNMSSSSIDYKQQPKTPGKISSFFSWKAAPSPGTESNTTEISESGHSPLPSPMNGSTVPTSFSSRIPSIDSYPGSAKMPVRSQTLPVDNDLATKLADMDAELREISSELAGSIRREMDLEDMVERLQLEASMGSDSNRRSSDYFSDSGYGSVKYPLSDAGSGKTEDMEKIKRSMEQERARMRVELSQKWQEERSRRQAFESHVQILESQVNQFRRDRVEASNSAVRVKELETALEDTKRRLAEERELKDNFEDLLTAMRVELEQHRNERDHLRDEVMPQLQFKMQEDLQALRNENATLSQARRMQLDMQAQQKRINSIAEENADAGMSVGLSRSNSLARMPSRAGGLSRSGSISRSRPTSMIGKEREFKESLVDKMKDVEMQRDALHKTVKSLLERLSYQSREHDKHVRMLELELDRERQSGSPRRRGYEREVTNLRDEINLLRRRADEALEQKWQCEKGLGGLKMDLDRAEQETTSLRALLQEHDIRIPGQRPSSDDGMADFHASASSLEDEYRQLQEEMEFAESNGSPMDATASEALAKQVHQQLATNKALRDRLSEAISKGERDQHLSAERISEMQTKLKFLEDALMHAQQHSEEEVAMHEAEVDVLKESHNAQLLRAKSGVRSPAMLSPRMPTSPFAGAKSPRLTRTTSGEGMALNQAIQTEALEAKVKELEKALRDADSEMEEVVGRMNKAQIEVAELQSDRDEALRQTRRLQAEIVAERQKFQPTF
ncbi:hypothetical protein AJ80_07205 [Polytolypa hystricis UAMH7299]|uniref:DUF7603 domain-containing protein n=1 Tax=Polytolypa hystricis (strain UAMH7299) TaxID=1447883 RepID=A0A2B7XQT7_POLH7|nr:hypothetical protein AJ80_07205 [Polytolypa hystricis UAMH7299]